MKTCGNCGASNADAARYCIECGKALAEPAVVTGPLHAIATPAPARKSLVASMAARADELQGKRRADVLFVLDCTGSMQGEIDAIRDAITGFADSIVADGVRVRVGMIEFRDRLINEEQRALLFAGQPFTADPAAFRREVAALRAEGGGDEPESSLDALLLAARQPFDPEADKVLVLVTDAPPHIPDKEARSLEQVLDALRAAGIGQIYLVIRAQEMDSQLYLKLLEGRRGMAWDLGKGDDFRARAEHFRHTLMALGKTIATATR